MGRTLTSLVTALAALLIGSVAHAYDDLEPNSFQYEGIQRNVGLYVPSTYHRGTPAPLIVALHGRFSSARAFHALSHLRRVADARGERRDRARDQLHDALFSVVTHLNAAVSLLSGAEQAASMAAMPTPDIARRTPGRRAGLPYLFIFSSSLLSDLASLAARRQ